MPSKVLPAFSPEQVCTDLKRVYAEVKAKKKHLFVSPLTTKWEAVAVWDFFHRAGKSVDASNVYAAPGRFNVLGYTREVRGETLIADLSKSR